MDFKLKSPFEPGGDQPEAIKKLVEGIRQNESGQVLLGVTGSGKTFSLAKVIEEVKLPTLIISHNKTLAAQLYQEFRDFFPENAVSYFVSYYDYYQPEAYIPQSDTYIEKETSVNDEIDKLRLAATTNLLTRPDTIVVASVSCIYNLGSPKDYALNMLELISGELIGREEVMKRLVDMQYERTRGQLLRGNFRVRGEYVEVWPADKDEVLRIVFGEKEIKDLIWVDSVDLTPLLLTGESEGREKRAVISPAKHFLADVYSQDKAVEEIKKDLAKRSKELKNQGKILEAHRLEQKVNYDLEMLMTMGYVNGIENYSRYFDGRQPGEAPFTLIEYMQHNAEIFGKKKFLTVIDESHITLPQIKGMYRGDEARKETLIEYGFRLPSARDNRPLKYEEFARRIKQAIYVSATPAEWEVNLAGGKVVEQLIRPTGLLEPVIEVRPIEGQVSDLIREIVKRKEKGERVLATTLTKKMAEELADYIKDSERVEEKIGYKLKSPIKVHYLHADVETLDRIDVLDDLRSGEVDVVVGINLLREGLDLPEVSLVAILDADKEGFLRSETSLIQTMGRAARHVEGKAILYADKITDSMRRAMDEVTRRRKIQERYNLKHEIVPKGIIKPMRDKLLKRIKVDNKKKKMDVLDDYGWSSPDDIDVEAMTPSDKLKLSKKLRRLMNEAAKNWEFERAASLRDLIEKIE